MSKKYVCNYVFLRVFEILSVDNKGESWTYLPYGPFKNCGEFEEWLHVTTAESDTLLYAMLDTKSLIPLGIAGFLRINPKHGVIEVGHLQIKARFERWLDPSNFDENDQQITKLNKSISQA